MRNNERDGVRTGPRRLVFDRAGQTKVGAKKKKKNRRASVVEVNADDDALAELQAEMASLAGSDDRAAEAGSPSVSHPAD